jgi:hypothetical protein
MPARSNRVIASAQAPAPDAEAIEDEALSGDANDAGHRWAKRRGLDDAGACPGYSAQFRAGFAAYVADQAK